MPNDATEMLRRFLQQQETARSRQNGEPVDDDVVVTHHADSDTTTVVTSLQIDELQASVRQANERARQNRLESRRRRDRQRRDLRREERDCEERVALRRREREAREEQQRQEEARILSLPTELLTAAEKKVRRQIAARKAWATRHARLEKEREQERLHREERRRRRAEEAERRRREEEERERERERLIKGLRSEHSGFINPYSDDLPREKVRSHEMSRTIQISYKLWGILQRQWRAKFREGSGYKRSTDHDVMPYFGLLGEKDGIVRQLVALPEQRDDWGDIAGCWNMPDLSREDLEDGMIRLAQLGYTLVGSLRIGRFHLDAGGDRGPSLEEFGHQSEKFFMLSIGIEGVCIESYDVGLRTVVEHGYEVLTSAEMAQIRKELDHGEEEAGNEEGDQEGPEEEVHGTGQDERQASEGDAGQAGGADAGDPAEEGVHPAGVPVAAEHGDHPEHPGQPEGGQGGLHAPRRGHNHPDPEGHRRGLASNELDSPDGEGLNDAERSLWGLTE